MIMMMIMIRNSHCAGEFYSIMSQQKNLNAARLKNVHSFAITQAE